MRHLHLAGMILVVGASVAGAATSQPTNLEQYRLELINRARAAPAVEAAGYGIDLNEGLAPGTITADPKQPLAFDPNLIAAAQDFSQWQLDNDTFSHTASGTPASRVAASGYAGSYAAENIAFSSYSGSPDFTQLVDVLHELLFVDAGIAGRGHRINLLSDGSKEIGVGLRTGSGYDPPPPGGSTYTALMLTEDYGTRSPIFLTGVVFEDLDHDGFYTPGEGWGGVTVTAVRQSDLLTQTVTAWPSGGYSLILPPGDYTVTGSGGGLAGVITYPGVVLASRNVKLDLDPGSAVAPCTNPACGDCSQDGQRNIVDALYAAQHAAGMTTLVGQAFTNCNVTGPAEPSPGASVDILDALTIAQFVTGLPTPLICC